MVEAKTMIPPNWFAQECRTPFVATCARIQSEESFQTRTFVTEEKIARLPGGLV